jgi:hypothetical protein
MLKAIAIFVAIAIAAVCATELLGYSSCQQSPEYNSEAAKTDKTHEKYCTTSYGLFTVGLFDVKEFIHENREDINAVSTIFIAAFTIILGLFTISLAGSTRIAANAAALSARAAVAIELPILAAEVSDFHFSSVQEQNANGVLEHFDCCFAHYLRIANGGRTKARPTQVEGGWHFGDELPPTPHYTFTKHLTLDAILDPEDDEPMRVRISDYHFKTGPDAYNAIRYAKSKLWFFCRITYQDFMRERHEIGFCWRRHEGAGDGFFVEERTPAYNRKT